MERVRPKSLSPARTAARWAPSSGIFAPTTGLDRRLFGDRGRLLGEVRREIMERLDRCLRTDSGLAGSDWQEWIKVYIAGGSASEWAGSRPNDAAQDLDVLIGVDYEKARSHSPALSPMDDAQIDTALNAAFRSCFNAENWRFPSAGDEDRNGGTWNLTAYANPDAWDIRSIKPYAAYDVTDMRWAVKPPHLPEHTLGDFRPAAIAQARAVAAEARAILAMDEPLRTREAKSLWDRLHAERSAAFSDQGEGWTDPGNLVEKWLAYHPRKLLQKIRDLALNSKTAFLANVDGVWTTTGSYEDASDEAREQRRQRVDHYLEHQSREKMPIPGKWAPGFRNYEIHAIMEEHSGGNFPDEHWEHLPDQQVNLRQKIHEHQGYVYPEAVRNKIHESEDDDRWHEDFRDPEPGGSDPKFVVHQGSTYLLDGHHRFAEARLMGHSSMWGKVYDTANPDHDPRNCWDCKENGDVPDDEEEDGEHEGREAALDVTAAVSQPAGPLYHGSLREFPVGTVLTPEGKDPGGSRFSGDYVYATTNPAAARYFGSMHDDSPLSDRDVYVHRVEPLGAVEPDDFPAEDERYAEGNYKAKALRVTDSQRIPGHWAARTAAAGHEPEMVPLEALHDVASMNHPGRTIGEVWEYLHPEDEARRWHGDEGKAASARAQASLRGYAEQNGEIPGMLITCAHGSVLEDGEHRYMAARDAGLGTVPVKRARGCLMPELHQYARPDQEHSKTAFLANIEGMSEGTGPQLTVRDYEGTTGRSDHITRGEEGLIPTAAIAHLHGVKGEVPGAHARRQGQAWEDFKAGIAARGITSPVFITVDHGQEPKISEGNHRRDAAVELGMPHVPVEIRYFGHAEQQGSVLDRMPKTASAGNEGDMDVETGTLRPHEFGRLTFVDYPGKDIDYVARDLHRREPRYMARLRQDMQQHGARWPVEIAHHDEDAWELGQGHHRLITARDLDMSLPYVRAPEHGDWYPGDDYFRENRQWRERREAIPEEYKAYMRRGEEDDPLRGKTAVAEPYTYEHDEYGDGVHWFSAQHPEAGEVGHALVKEQKGPGGPHAEIDRLEVDKNHRGHGVGTRLLENVERHFPGKELRLKPYPLDEDDDDQDGDDLEEYYGNRGFEHRPLQEGEPFELYDYMHKFAPRTAARGERPTKTKEQVGYREGTGKEHCGNCTMIRLNPPDFESHGCTLVKGIIDPDAVCDEWSPGKDRKKEAAQAPRLPSPGSWSPLKAWAATEPHRAAVRIAKDDLQAERPELTAPLDVRDDDEFAFAQDYDSRPGGEMLRRMLTAGGYPPEKTAKAFVAPHTRPDWNTSQVISRDGHQGVMLLRPDHWSAGTLAHEAGHMLHIHHAGIDMSRYSHPEDQQAPARMDDAVMHGPEFARHYATALEAVSPGAGAAFLAHHANALALIGNYRKRVHGLGPAEAAAGPDPAPRTAAVEQDDYENPDKVYLRFGRWPENERSHNFAMGWNEEGVSTYDLDRHGEPKDPDPSGYSRQHVHDEHCEPDCDLDWMNENYGETDPADRVMRAERARASGRDNDSDTGHLVKGTFVGFGHDAEPLLNNVRRVGDWIDHRHLFIPTARPHRLAAGEHDDDYEPPEEPPRTRREAAAGQEPQRTWADDARDQVSAIATAKGHVLDWVPDTRIHPTWPQGTRETAMLTARCRNCSPPKSGYELTLPVAGAEGEPENLQWDKRMIPAYLTRKCRQTHEPRPDTGGGRAHADKIRRQQAEEQAAGVRRRQEWRSWMDKGADDWNERRGQEDEAWRQHQAVSGYQGLTSGTGMIYLDIPPGIVRPAPGGVHDQHITVVYLGKDVSDEAFGRACSRAQEAASRMYPLDGVLRGVDTFDPDEKGKIPAFVPAYIPGIGVLRSMLEDLSASEHRHYRPHVTLGYYGKDEKLPPPHPPVNVRFARLFVKRGDQVVSFPLGTQS